MTEQNPNASKDWGSYAFEEAVRIIARDECKRMIQAYDEEVVNVRFKSLADRVVLRYKE